MNETKITTPARRIARETNRWTDLFQLRFDADGNLVDLLPRGMYYLENETPYAVKTYGTKNTPWNKMTYRVAQDLIDIYTECREEE